MTARRWPKKNLTVPQRIAWRRLFSVGHRVMLRFRADDGSYHRRCSHCGVTVPYSIETEYGNY